MRDVFVKRKDLIRFLSMRLMEEQLKRAEFEGYHIYEQGIIEGKIRALDEILKWVQIND